MVAEIRNAATRAEVETSLRQSDRVAGRGARAHRSRLMEVIMAKAYWVSCYRSITSPERLAAYAKLAGPAIAAAGGRFLARGKAAKAYEAGLLERIVVVEFDSVAAAVGCHDGPAYQEALKVFANAGDRDFRIVEGVE
jgi:uncharacterized protein (DUF1330 family)